MRRVGFIVVAAGLLVVAGCSSASDGARIDVPGKENGAAGSTLEKVAVGTSIIMPIGALCTTGEPVRITNVTVKDATGGMRITSWGTRYIGPGHDAPVVNQGAIPGHVSRIAGFSSRNKVRSPCISTAEDEKRSAKGMGEADQFNVSVTATSPRATMTGVVVHFGDGQTTFAQYDFAMCSTKSCAPVSS